MIEGHNPNLFRESNAERLVKQRELVERENALRFLIWHSLFDASNGTDLSSVFESIGQEMKDLEGKRYFGVRQIVLLSQLGQKDPDVKSLYEFMALARHDHPNRSGGEFEDTTTLLRVATLTHTWGDREKIDRIISSCRLKNIQPQTKEGIIKFLHWAPQDVDMKEFIINLIPLTEKMINY